MATIKDTADIRARLLILWKQIEDGKITSAEARLHMGLARAILETIKVEIAAAHLAKTEFPAVPIGRIRDAAFHLPEESGQMS